MKTSIDNPKKAKSLIVPNEISMNLALVLNAGPSTLYHEVANHDEMYKLGIQDGAYRLASFLQNCINKYN